MPDTGSVAPAVGVAEAPCERLEHPVHDRRVVLEEALHRGPGEDQHAQRALRHDICNGRLSEQDRDVAEELPLAERRALLAIDEDLRLALQDHVERAAREALAQDLLAAREPALLE